MTDDQKQLIGCLVVTPEFRTPRLTPSDFLKEFDTPFDGRQLTLQLLKDSISSSNGQDLGFAMIVGFTFGFSEEHFPLLNSLIREKWHFSHEDVVTALSAFHTPKAVEALYAATQWIPDYLDFDESRALAVKAIWALGRIDGPEADAVLAKLTADSNSILVEAATEQLQRRRSG